MEHTTSDGADPFIGRVIGDKFELHECVGQGASGTVYQANQISLGRTVAVKILRPELASDERLVRRFHDEALAASRLNHPNTVAVLDFGQTTDGLLYIVMEYLRGETLAAMLERCHPLDTGRIADLVGQILSGLEEAHAAGVIHADLKTDNVVVEHRRGGWDLAKVVDFGIARLAGSRRDHDDSSVCGTPEYMAPEVIAGAEPTVASDLYSAGVLLYELLVGRTPFADANATSLEILTRHLREQPVPPRAVVGDRWPINPELEAAALKALSKRPADRFRSAEEFRAAINDALTSREQAEQVMCRGCGVMVAASFRFCPQCGHGRGAPRRQTLEFAAAHVRTLLDSDTMAAADTEWHQPPLGVEDESTATREFAQAEPTAEAQSLGVFPLPLIGRDDELHRLTACLRGDDGSGAPGGSLVVAGPPGSGTSRLLRDACADAAAAGARVFLAAPDPSGLRTPYYPMRSILAAVLDLPPVCPYDALGEAVERVGASRRDLPGLAEIFGHSSALRELEPIVRRREAHAAALRTLAAAAESTPLALVFEDAHRYDGASVNLLRRLLQDGAGAARIAVTCTSEFARRMGVQADIELGPLSNEALAAIAQHVQSAVDNDAMPSVSDLIAHTDASPSHVAHLIRYAIEGGHVDAAPMALADLVAARVELLSQPARRVLQAAAALGAETTRDRIAAVLDQPVDELTDALAQLDARALAVLDGDVVWFPHQLVRRVAYAATPAHVRRELHAAIVRTLDDQAVDPAVAGHHCEQAGQLERAAELLSIAGDAAANALDDAAACDLYNRALACSRALLLASGDPNVTALFVETAVKLAEALRVAGELALARGVIVEARDRAHGSPALEAQLVRASAHLSLAEDDLERAIATMRSAVGLAIASGDAVVVGDMYLDLAALYTRAGNARRAVDELTEAVDLVTLGEGPGSTSGPTNLWHLLLRLAHGLRGLRRITDAIAAAEHALRHAERARSAIGRARCQALLADLFELAHDYDAAARHREMAVEAMRRIGDRRGTAELLLAGASATRSMLRIRADAMREARELAREIGWREGERRAEAAGD